MISEASMNLVLGSPSIRREWIEIPSYLIETMLENCLPPYGGSGLKYVETMHLAQQQRSPSIRREWIEMQR